MNRENSMAHHQMHHLCFKFITTQTRSPFFKQPFQKPTASLFHMVTSWVMIWFPTTIFYIVTVALETAPKISWYSIIMCRSWSFHLFFHYLNDSNYSNGITHSQKCNLGNDWSTKKRKIKTRISIPKNKWIIKRNWTRLNLVKLPLTEPYIRTFSCSGYMNLCPKLSPNLILCAHACVKD